LKNRKEYKVWGDANLTILPFDLFLYLGFWLLRYINTLDFIAFYL
jgi:hypothetical protein